MAIKKSELYSSLWASCDVLRGGMDASQYKDYVLTLLFIKYVSDKFKNDSSGIIEIPEGCSFDNIAELKGKKEIGNKMNIIIGELARKNNLMGVIDIADFNDEEKLGKGKEMIDRLTDLITIFEKPELDFSKNYASGDDLLGDAFEYLMKNFATESGKSKGQFYTPSEVSRVIAKVLGIKNAKNSTTFYDPTCGSGSLLLKIIDEAEGKGSIYGQEKDVATAALSKMNMILHNIDVSDIHKGQSTLSDPYFLEGDGTLKTFDYVVANPPFSSKNWSTGLDPQNDVYGRFEAINLESKSEKGKTVYLTPPSKNGDYAFLLHIIKSIKSTGKGACILPHGVLFRGNSEAEIRKSLISRGYIKGIIGLPTNLFFGTGIPACIIVIDKENAKKRDSIFMIDASKGFIKDGNKNRLREQDIHKIVDVFNKQIEIPKYSRKVSIEEIKDNKNDYNLNIPRYIDSSEEEDFQDIEAHLLGGIPKHDIDALEKYWTAYPSLRKELFIANKRNEYVDLIVSKDKINQTIFTHPQFMAFTLEMDKIFAIWKNENVKLLKTMDKGIKPKQIITQISEDLLSIYTGNPLIDNYDIYQYLMNYWDDVMQDDCYYIAAEGWNTELTIKKQTKTNTEWDCDFIPKSYIIERYFNTEKTLLEQLETEKETIVAKINEMEEEYSDDEGIFSEFDKVNKATVSSELKVLNAEIRKNTDPTLLHKKRVLEDYLKLFEELVNLNKKIKNTSLELDIKVINRYKTLTEEEIKLLVVEDKWMVSIETKIKTEMEQISGRLTQRIKELAERYETHLSKIKDEVETMEAKVNAHLEKMGFIWD